MPPFPTFGDFCNVTDRETGEPLGLGVWLINVVRLDHGSVPADTVTVEPPTDAQAADILAAIERDIIGAGAPPRERRL